jgi:HEAT repeats
MKQSRLDDRDLVQIALDAGDESDAYWDSVRELQRRGTREVFELSSELCAGQEPHALRVGLDVLGQLGYERGRPFLADSLPIALRLARDTEQVVLRSALAALGNLGDPQALPVLLSHMGAPDAATRLVVAQAMPSVLADPPQPEGRCRVTAGSQSPGIGRVLRVTKGHQPGRFRIREDDTGVCRTPEDTSPPRFGTVRPRVQIPGPRPISEYESRHPRLSR